MTVWKFSRSSRHLVLYFHGPVDGVEVTSGSLGTNSEASARNRRKKDDETKFGWLSVDDAFTLHVIALVYCGLT